MKDRDARDQITGLQEQVRRLEESVNSMPPLVVQHCPKCKHETMQTRDYGDFYDAWVSSGTVTFTGVSGATGPISSPEGYFRCLNCGNKINVGISWP